MTNAPICDILSLGLRKIWWTIPTVSISVASGPIARTSETFNPKTVAACLSGLATVAEEPVQKVLLFHQDVIARVRDIFQKISRGDKSWQLERGILWLSAVARAAFGIPDIEAS